MAGLTVARQQLFITNARNANRAVWDGINALKAMQREWDAEDLGNNPFDGAGDNLGVSSAEVGAVLFATTNALIAVLDAGSATNMAALL